MSKSKACQLVVNGVPCEQPAYRDGYCQEHWPHQAYILASFLASASHLMMYGTPGIGTSARYEAMEYLYYCLTGEPLGDYQAREHLHLGSKPGNVPARPTGMPYLPSIQQGKGKGQS